MVGRNLRYLGKVRQLASTAAAKELLLAHAIARTARRLVQAQLRQRETNATFSAVAHMLNRLAGHEELLTVAFKMVTDVEIWHVALFTIC